MKLRAVSTAYWITLGLNICFILAGHLLLHLSFRGVVKLRGIDRWSVTALVVLLISVVVFAIVCRVLLWGDPAPRLGARRARRALSIVALAGLASSFIAVGAKWLMPAGVWQSNRISKSGNDYYAYIDGVRRLVSAFDFEMQARSIQLVPLGSVLFLASGFLVFLAVDWLEPGLLFRVVFAPWRLIANKDRRSGDLDEFGGWD